MVIAGSDPEGSPYLLNSKLVTTAIQSGATYRARYRAYNIHGWGPYSPEGEILAAIEPGQPSEPAISIDGTDVKIQWSAPADTGGTGVAITSYRVEIEKPDGTFEEELVNCDGTDASILSSLECLIPMEDLISTFGFTQGDEIKA